MFDTLLIANRGEIACRVIRTAKAMGLRTVAVFSDVDAGALHVEMADEAVSLGGHTPAESYLRGDAIIAAAQATGAQAIHPGYGFLSENPEFVEAVEAAGLTFVGPSAKAIRAMGLKDAAKAVMEEAGVPVVPGYHGDSQEPWHLAEMAEQLGYPVLIKAVAGGGGKGMRLVETPEDFASALEAAQREGQAAFGNAHVLIEKFVAKPRHIEVQVVGDGSHAVHLFERDCSLQRRHQKVIEEAPAPGMTEDMRAAMGDAAVRAAAAIGYAGAGTIEFIVDASEGLRADRFYFMEMNTRLQVEHPVTECITGVDLVEWQLRIAGGETLAELPTDLVVNGHSFEARIYAEDAGNDFLPVTGRLSHVAFPEAARSDSGIRAGDEISPFYDPMIAKLIVHGPTREVALARLRAALAETELVGTTTNLGFLSALAGDADFASGDVDTGLIARKLEALTDDGAPEAAEIIAAGQAASGLNGTETGALAGFALWEPLKRAVPLRFGDEDLALRVEVLSATAQRWHLGDAVHEVAHKAGAWRLGGHPLPKALVLQGQVTVFGAPPRVFDVPDPDATAEDAAGGNVIEAPMPGMVTRVMVAAGAMVRQGEALAVLEAMKMEHTLAAPRDGVIAEVLASEGDQVSAGARLVELVDEET